MQMNRRGFLKLLGAFTAASVLPSFPVGAKIAESKRFLLNDFVIFECAPLEPGTHTVTWFAGEQGIFVGGIEASGGETLIKQWVSAGQIIDRPSIKLGGIYVDYRAHYDFTDPELQDKIFRGERLQIK